MPGKYRKTPVHAPKYLDIGLGKEIGQLRPGRTRQSQPSPEKDATAMSRTTGRREGEIFPQTRHVYAAAIGLKN